MTVSRIPGLSQTENQPEYSDESKIISDWKIINYENKHVPVIKIKQRKNDSPLFANEFIPFRNGIIINSISSSWGQGKYEINTSFYYLDAATQILSKLIVPGIDTIESIISDSSNQLYYSCKKNGRQFIHSYNSGKVENLLSISDSISNLLDTSAWIKLGYYKNMLYALSPNGVFRYNSAKWEQITKISVDDDLSRRRFRWGFRLLPLLNIRITDDAVWFAREVLHGRDCNLLRLDLKTGKISELFDELGYTDRTKKEVYSFSILSDHSLLITATRLMYSYLTFKTDSRQTEVWIFNNTIKTDSGELKPFPVTDIIYRNDTAYLLSVNGIFMKINATLSPVIFWENGHQQIKFSLGVLDYEFVPRSAMFLDNNKLLVGGMWGGIYLVDLANNQITCLDDVKHERKVNITSL